MGSWSGAEAGRTVCFVEEEEVWEGGLIGLANSTDVSRA